MGRCCARHLHLRHPVSARTTTLSGHDPLFLTLSGRGEAKVLAKEREMVRYVAKDMKGWLEDSIFRDGLVELSVEKLKVIVCCFLPTGQAALIW